MPPALAKTIIVVGSVIGLSLIGSILYGDHKNGTNMGVMAASTTPMDELSNGAYIRANLRAKSLGYGGGDGPALMHSSKRVNQEFIDPIEEAGMECINGYRTEVYHNDNLKIYCENATYHLKLHIDLEKCSHYHNPGFPPGCKSAWYTVRKAWW